MIFDVKTDQVNQYSGLMESQVVSMLKILLWRYLIVIGTAVCMTL